MVNKHLLPVYDLPMIYYPIRTLLNIGVKTVVVVTNAKDAESFKALLGNAVQGVPIRYAVQQEARGAADALAAARDAVEFDSAAFILGDNVFLGDCRPFYDNGAVIFVKKTDAPSAFGVAELREDGKPLSIEEKPCTPRRSFDGCYYAVTGLYLYDNSVFDIIEGLKPSARGEVEMCDVNRAYMQRGQLKVEILGDDVIWQDAGTPDGLLAAGNAVYRSKI